MLTWAHIGARKLRWSAECSARSAASWHRSALEEERAGNLERAASYRARRDEWVKDARQLRQMAQTMQEHGDRIQQRQAT